MRRIHLGSGCTPHSVVVRPHEEIGDAVSHIPHDPLVKGFRLESASCGTMFECEDQAV